MKRILKYGLPNDLNEIEMFAGAVVVHVGLREEHEIYLWVETPIAGEAETRRFAVVATGQQVDDSAEYRGTVLEGSYVWHVYERRN